MIAMAPRAAGSVGHVPHAGGAAARLSGGIIWLETEGHASFMRSRRALGPARAPFFGTLGAVFTPLFTSFFDHHKNCSRRLVGSAYDRGGARLHECAAA